MTISFVWFPGEKYLDLLKVLLAIQNEPIFEKNGWNKIWINNVVPHSLNPF